MARKRGGKIGQMLLSAGLITEAQLAEALAHQELHDCKLGSALVALGAIDEKILAVFLAMQRGVQTIHLAEQTVKRDVLALVPPEVARRLGAVPVERCQDAVKIALIDPADRQVVRSLERLTGLKVQPFIAPQSAILAALERFYPAADTPAVAAGGLDMDRLRARLSEARRILESIERELV